MKKYLFTTIAIFLLTSIALPQTDIGLKAIGAKVGYVMPEDPIENTLGFGVAADLGTITSTIHLNGIFEYWGKSYDVSYYEWSWSEFIFGATAKYYFSTEGQFHPYAGGGIALIIGRSSWEYTGPTYGYFGETKGSDSDTDIGFHICGGAEYPLSPTLNGLAEVKYTIDGADYFAILVGVMYKMGK